ncbi:MAG: NADH-quinone oxidoreductase subunit NuoH [Candidatus Omnitrophica bacterium]|nr:NADH-quinone oxidoreductase subunit NuoH [Candidatus Omnitrophota bacterium]MDD5737831.1 NADH-quinone oxidoreductase subunit NuoH [Candidatus Omnitrophota bacterium]
MTVSILTFIIMIIVGVMALGFIAVSAMFLIWWERKVSAHIQTRYGPMRVGWHGALQSVADVIKLLLKENITPAGADKVIWWTAPFFAVVPSVMVFAPIGHDLNIGVLYIMAMTSLCVLGIFMAGWGSNNKYSLLGGMRSAAQIISYEIPLILAMVTAVMFAGTLSIQKIVEAQKDAWFVFHPSMAVAFLVFLIAGTAEVNRTPFDIPEAESELVAGFHTEYSGMKFAMFFLGEYTNMLIISALAAVLFLGGWNGPFLHPILWFLIKTYGIVTLMMWIRWTLPRVRVDQLMNFAWKVLTPVSFVNLAVAGWVLVR